jgi:hypothetical protein
MQMGPPLGKQVAKHPKYMRDLTNVFDFGSRRRRIRNDAKGEISFGWLLTNEGASAPCQRYIRQLSKNSKNNPGGFTNLTSREEGKMQLG